MKTFLRQAQADSDKMLLWNQEKCILDLTELICTIMEDQKISRKQLADRLGKTKGYVTQLLDGTRNMTIRTISDVFTNLGCEVQFLAKDRVAGELFYSARIPQQPSQCYSEDHTDWNLQLSECGHG